MCRSTSRATPTESDRYWQKNFELLVDITDAEDFATAAGIQTRLRHRRRRPT